MSLWSHWLHYLRSDISHRLSLALQPRVIVRLGAAREDLMGQTRRSPQSSFGTSGQQYSHPRADKHRKPSVTVSESIRGVYCAALSHSCWISLDRFSTVWSGLLDFPVSLFSGTSRWSLVCEKEVVSVQVWFVWSVKARLEIVLELRNQMPKVTAD